MSWDRLVWAAKFSGGNEFLVGEAWDAVYPVLGRPMRTLLFSTRRQAREWCAEKMDVWAGYPEGDPVRRWKVKAVRVRESIQEVKP